jgi:hypothetical protein
LPEDDRTWRATMKGPDRRGLRYANVMSTIAVFIALGGVG